MSHFLFYSSLFKKNLKGIEKKHEWSNTVLFLFSPYSLSIFHEGETVREWESKLLIFTKFLSKHPLREHKIYQEKPGNFPSIPLFFILFQFLQIPLTFSPIFRFQKILSKNLQKINRSKRVFFERETKNLWPNSNPILNSKSVKDY